MNWIFNAQKSIAGYTVSKNPAFNRLKIQFVELDFSKIKYRWIITIHNKNFENLVLVVFELVAGSIL